MKKILLNNSEYDFLTKFLLTDRKDLSLIIKDFYRSDLICIELHEDLADEIRDLAGEKLQQIGFDKDYNLNKEGELLTRLIDDLLT